MASSGWSSTNLPDLMRACLTNRYPRGTLCLAACALVLLNVGCGTLPKKEHASIAAPVYVGSIASVNRESHYVLLDVNGTTARPEAGTELTAIATSGEATRLKVAAERKRPFVTADIVSGEPVKGERVYR
ncbi:MAG: hypothetical protein M3032_09900 [Verrucomicrobiota bacterium]|nr:hypothetical protein [Verrucomicrobiota bacterium]